MHLGSPHLMALAHACCRINGTCPLLTLSPVLLIPSLLVLLLVLLLVHQRGRPPIAAKTRLPRPRQGRQHRGLP